jgi:uncharacterized protein (DUF362 family)
LERLRFQPNPSVRSVVIKVNICEYRTPETGAITDPLLLGALLGELRRVFPASGLTIIENDATTLEMGSAFRLLGFSELAARFHATLLNAAGGEWVEVEVPGGRVFEKLEIPAAVHSADLLVNLAKLKTNALTILTGCLKNTFGLLRLKRKVSLHGRIDDVLVDINKVIRPGLCIVDGVVGMEGVGGPAFGRPKRCDLLIAGRNPVAVDACAARVMGFRPLSIRHIRLCHQAGLGPVDYELSTDIAGFDYRRYRFRFDRLEYTLRNLVRSRAGVAT